jgi:pimeloyl-ACP methyl ester carboxylesterase
MTRHAAAGMIATVPHYLADDATALAYRLGGDGRGDGPPLVCLPGGPMLDATYLGDLGGLSATRRLVLVDPRATGDSATPADLSSCRCDRLVADVEALRVHLGADHIALLGHSAGANLAVRYVERHPDRVSRLVLVTPSVFAVGIPVPAAARRAALDTHAGASWYPDAVAAFDRINAGEATADDGAALTPSYYARWDDAARAFEADMNARRKPEVAAAFRADGAFDPPTTRAALARFAASVLLIAGGGDPGAPPSVVAEYAALFPDARVATLPGGGHFPWLDDPTWFSTTVTEFLT